MSLLSGYLPFSDVRVRGLDKRSFSRIELEVGCPIAKVCL